MDIVAKMDEGGRVAWITAMILGFIIFWPAGLAILAFLIWSGRMRGMHHNHQWNHDMRDEWRTRCDQMREEMRARKEEWRERKRAWREEMKGRWHEQHQQQHAHHQHYRDVVRPSGNAAFDEYKMETIRRLEEEQQEFQEFLDRLRKSKDAAEFDQFMADRRNNAADEARDVTPPPPEHG